MDSFEHCKMHIRFHFGHHNSITQIIDELKKIKFPFDTAFSSLPLLVTTSAPYEYTLRGAVELLNSWSDSTLDPPCQQKGGGGKEKFAIWAPLKEHLFPFLWLDVFLRYYLLRIIPMEELEVFSDGSTADLHEANLPPVDRGRGAWGFLAACFMIEALIWGMCMFTP